MTTSYVPSSTKATAVRGRTAAGTAGSIAELAIFRLTEAVTDREANTAAESIFDVLRYNLDHRSLARLRDLLGEKIAPEVAA
jgi:hypothetical protein